MRFSMISLGALLLASAAPAMAQETEETPAITVTGGATLTSDYRFRGLTQSDEDPAIQATVNINSASGFYAGVWASSIDGSGDTPALTGYGDVEVDLYAGFTKGFGGATVDVGLLYYLYPDGVSGLNTDFFEPYASVSYTIGPVTAKVGAAYAWGGQDGLNFTGGTDDSLYVYLDGKVGIPSTPLTLKGHFGATNGSLGLVNLTSASVADDDYIDWSVGVEWAGGPLVGGVSYIDTDITSKFFAPVGGKFDQKLGRGATVVAYIGVAF